MKRGTRMPSYYIIWFSGYVSSLSDFLRLWRHQSSFSEIAFQQNQVNDTDYSGVAGSRLQMRRIVEYISSHQHVASLCQIQMNKVTLYYHPGLFVVRSPWPSN